jgi:hypothetical protein
MRKRRWVRDTGKAWPDRIANPATTRISQGSRGLTVVVGRIWSVFFTANEETALNPDPFDPVATKSSGWRQPGSNSLLCSSSRKIAGVHRRAPSRYPAPSPSPAGSQRTLRWRRESGANPSLKWGFRRLGNYGNSEAFMDDNRSGKGLFRARKRRSFSLCPLAASPVIWILNC